MDMKIDNSTLTFLSDWKERTKKQQKKNFWVFIVVFILTFVLCLLASFWFQDSNTDRIVRQNQKYIEDSARQATNHIEQNMANTVLVVQNFAEQYARLIRNRPELTYPERLESLDDKNLFDRIAYITPDGLDTSLEGVADVSDRTYFKDSMAGNTGWDFIRESRVTGRPSVVFYAPVVSEEGEIIGSMSGFYSPERMDDIFSYDFFNYVPRTYLLRGDGVVITSSSEAMITDNILEILSQKRFTGDTDYDDVMDYIQDPETRSVTFTYLEQGKTYVGVVSQFSRTSNSDWLVLSILPYDVTEGMISNANANGLVFLGAIVIVFFFSLIFIQFTFQKMNQRFEDEMTLAMDSLNATMGYERYQLSIIQTLANIYTSVYYTSLADGSYNRLKETNDTLSSSYPDRGRWDENVNAYCDNFVAESYREEMRKFMKTGSHKEQDPDSIESMEYMRVDDRWRRAIMIPMTKEGSSEVTAYVFAVQKIDQEKKKELRTKQALEEAYEAAQLANNAKTSFLSNMSHDIRTPMNAIVGMTAIASAHLNEPEKMADCLKKINVSSKHLLGLINEVLDMSKIESGKVDLSEEEFSISELIDTLVSLNMPLVKEKNHTLLVSVKNLVHEDVVGDSVRLQQVLTNLLTNAIKYTPENGKIEITVTEKETNKATVGWYEIAVKDNGIGMTEEYQKKLFEPFVRASDNRIKNIQGTGLGMPIARNIVRMMNGDITVESRINEGSTFTVSFVLKLQSDRKVDYEKFVNLPVLVVDDDINACESTCTMLDSLEMQSEWVTTGREAIDRLAEHHEKEDDFYAVIVDWMMPDMDGVAVTRQIRALLGDEIPIIIMSAYDWMDIEQEAKEAGVNAFLSKPLFKSKIVDLFGSLLQDEGREAESEVQAASGGEIYNLTGKRVLLVEDNEINREIAVELLTMVGLELETAENGKESVELFKRSEPGYYDLILMDVQMPVMDGYEATQAIRRLPRMDANTIPIIAMTANAFSSDVRNAYNAGMNGHIAKPIDMKHVVNVLGEQFARQNKNL